MIENTGEIFLSIMVIISKNKLSVEESLVYHLISEFNVYGIAVIYSMSGLIAWIRSNGSYADIHVGAMTEEAIDAFDEHLGEIEWK